MTTPDDVADLRRQVESARAWAAEYIRRADLALHLLGDVPCSCRDDECTKCKLTRVLLGDE